MQDLISKENLKGRFQTSPEIEGKANTGIDLSITSKRNAGFITT